MPSPPMERTIHVEPCQEYTIRFMIFDVGDFKLDSGLFLAPIEALQYNRTLVTDDHVYIEGCASKPVDFILSGSMSFHQFNTPLPALPFRRRL
ncbi:MAG: hypothetical protein IPL65_22360 [Lewinellaceae bacterium]|nr:hypothetical protein [Lewinellaceae bacterium]